MEVRIRKMIPTFRFLTLSLSDPLGTALCRRVSPQPTRGQSLERGSAMFLRQVGYARSNCFPAALQFSLRWALVACLAQRLKKAQSVPSPPTQGSRRTRPISGVLQLGMHSDRG